MLTKLGEFSFLGTGLRRPECVLATSSGDVFVTDSEGVSVVARDGSVRRISASNAPQDFFPNGIALLPGRAFLIADLGKGGVWRLNADGTLTPSLLEVEGMPLPPTNFVGVDRAGRQWVTVSTRLTPRTLAAKPDFGDGFIVMRDERGARIVADGLGFTNEASVSPDGQFLYVNETYRRCLSRYRIKPDTSLGEKEVVCAFGQGTFPDGLAFDAEGQVWIASVNSNRLIRVDPNSGKESILFEDCDAGDIVEFDAAFMEGRDNADRRRAMGAAGVAKNLSSIAFGGPGLRTIYCGSLDGTRLLCFESPVAGAETPHWNH